MRILISGYVPAEGRHSMVRTARCLQRCLSAALKPPDEAALDGGSVVSASSAAAPRRLSVKAQKRVLLPLRLRLRRYDVLHIIDNDYAAAVPRSRALHTVVSCHDMMPFLVHGSLERAFPSWCGRMFYRRGLDTMARCRYVVCDSEFTKRSVLAHTACREEQLRVVYLGVEETFRPLSRDSDEVRGFEGRHGLAGRPVILHVGTVEPYKNIETVIRVVAAIRKATGAPIMFLKVGGRFNAGHRELIGRLGLADSVIHLTGVSENELVVAYNAASVLLWPSYFEGFGLPALEAMACGTPVVCSNGGSLPEVVGDAALVHAAEDVEGFAASCRQVLEDETLQLRLREAGLRRAQGFTWDKFAAACYGLYKAL